MVVLRCPYCGEELKKDVNFCSHCGKEIDKPSIDEYATYHREVGGLMVSFFGFIVLWFVLGLVVGFITHAFNLLPPYSPWLLIITTVLTVIVFLFIKIK